MKFIKIKRLAALLGSNKFVRAILRPALQYSDISLNFVFINITNYNKIRSNLYEWLGKCSPIGQMLGLDYITLE